MMPMPVLTMPVPVSVMQVFVMSTDTGEHQRHI